MNIDSTLRTAQIGVSHFSSPFWILARKEIADMVRSWRFRILILLVLLILTSSITHVVEQVPAWIQNNDLLESDFPFLKIFTSSGSTPSYYVLISFVAPLLGISLGFDRVNSEFLSGTMTRIVTQPIYRDNILLAKFFAPIFVLSVLFLCVTGLVVGTGMIWTGLSVQLVEIIRIFAFIFLLIVYLGFWLAFSLLMSIVFRQPSSAALTSLSLWLFLTIFFPMLTSLIVQQLLPLKPFMSVEEQFSRQELVLNILRVSPSQLFIDGSTSILMPTVRGLGPLNIEQMEAAIPAPLPIIDSLLIVWSQLTGLIAGTLALFAISYYLFMRREIRN